MSPNLRGIRALVAAGAMAAAVVGLIPGTGPAEAGKLGPDFTPSVAKPNIHIPTANATLTPGGTTRLESGGWFGPTTCPNKVKYELEASNHTYNLGSFQPKFSVFEHQAPWWVYKRALAIPNGAKAGNARIVAKQDWEFKFPAVGCLKLFRVNASKKVVISGAVGNDPPVISGAQVASPATQGTATLSWTSSEACTTTIELWADTGDGAHDLMGNLTTDLAAVSGANTFEWDTTFHGSFIPPGEHQLRLFCVDSSSARSATKIVTFDLGFGT